MLIVSTKSNGCSCSNVDLDMNKYLSACESIFISRLVSARYVEAEPNPNYMTFSKVEGKLAEPTKIYKGNPDHITGLETSMLGTSCEGYLSVGEEYLVCGGKESVVRVAQCDFTSPIKWGNGRVRHELLESYKNDADGTSNNPN